mgnify:CR=1 FL=1
MIKLSVNGDSFTTENSSLADFLKTLDTGDQFAVARNGEFVPKSQYDQTTLTEGDTLDIVTPVGGG